MAQASERLLIEKKQRMQNTSPRIYYPKWLVTFLLLMVFYVPILNPLLPKTEFGAGLPDMDIERIVSFLLILILVWKWISGPKFLTWHFWLTNLCIFSLIFILSPFWSEAYTYNSTLLQDMFKNTIMPLCVAITAFGVLRTDRAIQRYCVHACYAACMLSAFAIYQFITKSSIAAGELRSVATFDNPNPFAVFLVLLLPVIIYATESKRIPRLIGYSVQTILLIGVLTTVSRKGIFTAFITIEIFFVLTRRYKEIILSLGLSFLLGIIALGYSNFSDRFDDKEIEKNITGREAMVVAGLKMYQEKPVIGYGYKGYFENFGNFFVGESRHKFDAHNEYITTLVNLGAVGFLFFILIFLLAIFYGWKQFKKYWRRRMLNQSMLTMIGIVSAISFMFNQYFSGGLFYLYPTVVCLLFANIGLMLARRNDI